MRLVPDTARCVGAWVEHWARETPDTIALAERDPDGQWRQLSYGQARRAIGAIAQSLIDMRLPDDAPVVVLSDNSVDHALLSLAAMHVGRAVCAVSSGYCRATRDYTRIRRILRMLAPALVYASDAFPYAPAVSESEAEVVLGHGAASCTGALPFESLLQTTETPAVSRAFEAIAPDDHAEYLLTQASTGEPEVVVHTHRMLAREQEALAQAFSIAPSHRPVLLDVLPWSHIDTGTRTLNLALRNGGTLVVDEARTAPQREPLLRNLRQVRPTLHMDDPHGWELLLPLLEDNPEAAREAFARLRVVCIVGAELEPSIWQRLEVVAQCSVRDEAVRFAASRGRAIAATAPLHEAGAARPAVVQST
jgi:feruloyl-CoA synthase